MSDSEAAGWEELAAELEAHGIPPRRAKIVAQVAETGRTYQEIADALDVQSKGSVGNQVQEFRAQVEDAEWLAANAPDV